jgi:uncharacterized protein YuzE
MTNLHAIHDEDADILYINLHDPPMEADDTTRMGDVLIRKRNNATIGITVLNWSKIKETDQGKFLIDILELTDLGDMSSLRVHREVYAVYVRDHTYMFWNLYDDKVYIDREDAEARLEELVERSWPREDLCVEKLQLVHKIGLEVRRGLP